MCNYTPLTPALDGWFNKSLCDMPETIRQLIEHEFFPMPWDKLSPDDRRSVAAQLDYQRDPATESERQYWSDFFDKLDDLQSKFAQWKAVATPTATDLATKESRVCELQQEIDRMDQILRRVRGDFAAHVTLPHPAHIATHLVMRIKSPHFDEAGRQA
jgi:hypothetical protein